MPKSGGGWESGFISSVIHVFAFRSRDFGSGNVSIGDGSVDKGKTVDSVAERENSVDGLGLDDAEDECC